MHIATETTTLLATGAGETATGSRLAMRGMIWFAFTHHRDAVAGDVKPADMKAQIREALKAVGRGKGECSTKATQAGVIGEKFAGLFAKELASDYEGPAQFIQACFNAAEAAGAGSVLRLVDWAKHGNPNHADDAKAAKKAEAEAKKAEAEDAARAMAEAATPLASMDLDAVAKPIEVQNLNPDTVDAETKAATVAGMVEDLSDTDLAALAEVVAAEMAKREAAAQAEVAAA